MHVHTREVLWQQLVAMIERMKGGEVDAGLTTATAPRARDEPTTHRPHGIPRIYTAAVGQRKQHAP